jgi:xanthine dehydrogenase YagR molybdenum-binding subunit
LKPVWKRLQPATSLQPGVGSTPELDDRADIAVKSSERVFEAAYSTPVQTHSALETHGVTIDYRDDQATVYASTQGTSTVADQIGEFLGLPRSKYEVVCEYVGGGFGAKFQIGKEGVAAAETAAKFKRPASCFCDREEEHLDTGNRPSLVARARIGYAKDGTIFGGQVAKWGGVGIDRRGGGAQVPSGRYDLGQVHAPHQDVSFNAGGPRAMRAPGFPQGAFVEELMLDEIAALASIDPLQLRSRLDADASGARREMYQLGAELIGWANRRPTGAQNGVTRRGFGMGSTTWGSNRTDASADVVIRRDGSVEARTGTQDIGTGQRTIMGILAAEHLGVPLEIVDVKIGRSSLPPGPASGGSVTAPSTAPAMIQAAIDARRKFLVAVAEMDNLSVEELELKDGSVLHLGAPHGAFAELCKRLPTDSIIGAGQFSRTGGLHWGEGHSHGAQFVELEVDTETGVIRVLRVVAIQSCGRVVCRKTAESQIIGGVIQGLSYALFEDRILDRVTGAMVNPNLEMYKILGPVDMPAIVPVLWDPSQTGVRSLGEPPVIPTAGAVACALFNAIGKPVRHLPLTPDKVLAALDARASGGAA